jgi:hypothetical protein
MAPEVALERERWPGCHLGRVQLRPGGGEGWRHNQSQHDPHREVTERESASYEGDSHGAGELLDHCATLFRHVTREVARRASVGLADSC